jgi:hypothetical protein
VDPLPERLAEQRIASVSENSLEHALDRERHGAVAGRASSPSQVRRAMPNCAAGTRASAGM